MSTLLSLGALLLAATAPQPLPDHVDIPDGFSTVICPDQKAAKTMLDSYYAVQPAPNDHTIDTTLFFDGLKATGCVQDGEARQGTVTIDAVQQRKTIALADGPERVMRYSGRDSSGKVLAGLVDEYGNNGYPRTELGQWLQGRSADGWISTQDNDPASFTFYRCDSAEAARRVVSALSKSKTEKAFKAAMTQALAREKCRAATDRYFILNRFESAGVGCGDECFLDINALEARDRSGVSVGLVYDGSLM